MTQMMSLNDAYCHYEKLRGFMPSANFPDATREVKNLAEIIDEFDVAVLDSFGVLNVGQTAIPGIVETIKMLREREKHIIVLTNGARLDQPGAVAKIRGFGFDIASADVISSRAALENGLKTFDPGMTWGIMAPENANCHTLGVEFLALGDDADTYANVDGFILLSSHNWTRQHQDLLQKTLAHHHRPTLVGNPDLVAPVETGMLTQPGYFALLLQEATDVEPVNFGKPHADVFVQTQQRIKEACGVVDSQRIIMVGDSLHTDILGGAATGFKTVLTTQDGFFAGANPHDYINKSGIRPDFMLPRI